MGIFKFRLQTVLNIREQYEKQAKIELGLGITILEREKNRLDSLYTQKQDIMQYFKSEMTDSLNVGLMANTRLYINSLEKSIDKQNEKVNIESQNVDKLRGKLETAIKERKVLEKLQEKKYKEYLTSEIKAEQIFNDEITGYNHAIRNNYI